MEVKQIIITRAEGPGSRIPHKVYSWRQANEILGNMAVTAPESKEGYDKTDFTIEFINGFLYQGCYPLRRNDVQASNLYDHIRRHLENRALEDNKAKIILNTFFSAL